VYGLCIVSVWLKYEQVQTEANLTKPDEMHYYIPKQAKINQLFKSQFRIFILFVLSIFVDNLEVNS
jgi:hypothetical protein